VAHNCNSSIYFNKQCLKKGLTPSYRRIKVPHTSPASKYMQQKISWTRIRDELKFLHIKKQHINQQILKIELFLANYWDRMWSHIQQSIEAKLKYTVHERYYILNTKLAKLTKEQTKTPHKPHTFFPRLVINTPIKFSERESLLLNKGPKYNLHIKRADWLTNLALEAETAITQLPPHEREFYRKQVAELTN
jgi:hypothetical protein